MRGLLFTFFLFSIFCSNAQTKIYGLITDGKNQALAGANVFIKGAYDGSSTDANGLFEFNTSLKGEQVLAITMLGFEPKEITLNCQGEALEVNATLKEAFSKLKAVQINAGRIEASDKKRAVMLRPLDIVTTAGANGDIVGALNTLPGTATVGNDGRLFVRGGSANETAIFFDGMKVNNAYGSTLGGLPTRSRFSPQLFTGTFFSTGGYSAEYGQALSSVLALYTINMPLRSQTDISLMTVGGSVSHTEVWEKSAATASVNYLNLAPYQKVVPQNIQWDKAPQQLNSEILYRHKPAKNTLIKAFYANQNGSLSIYRENPGQEHNSLVDLDNRFHYGNISLQQNWGKKWLLKAGGSLSLNNDRINYDSLNLTTNESLVHLKSGLSYFAHPRLNMKIGAEYFNQHYQQVIPEGSRSVSLPLSAAYSEANYHFSDALALNAGLRWEHFNQKSYLMPRLAAALKLAEEQQISLAYGQFIQQQKTDALVVSKQLAPARSEHYLINYQYAHNLRTLRIEAYVKNYQSLLKSEPTFRASGEGYAQGFDLFYRDRKSIKNLDFWITYSWVDSQREFGRFTEMVQPSFAPRHNASVVGKYWIEKLNSQLGASFSFNDGFRYDNPNITGEMESKTKHFASLSLNWSYLPKPNLIIHLAVTNVLGRDNIFGYRYSSQPNQQGQFSSLAMGQPADRFIFIGVFYTLSADKKANQLNNL